MLIAAASFCSLAVTIPSLAQRTDALPVEAALKKVSFGDSSPIAFSEDGKWFAYVVRDNQHLQTRDRETWPLTGIPSWGSGTDIRVQNIDTGKKIDVTGGKGDNWLPAWSPNGHYLAFLSDRDGGGEARLWVWDSFNDDLKQISGVDVRGNEIKWTPDSQKLLVTTLPDGLTPVAYAKILSSSGESEKHTETIVPGSSVKLYESSGPAREKKGVPNSDPWSLDITLRDLSMVDVGSGKRRILIRASRIATFLVSMDGSQIAYTIPKRFEKPGSQQVQFDIAEINIATKSARVITSDVRLDYDGSELSWSPSGLQLSFHAGGGEERTFDCYVVDLQDGSPRNVTTLPPSPRSGHKSSVPLWDSSRHIYFVHNGALWRTSADQPEAVEIARVRDREITHLIPRSENLLWTTDHGDSTIVVTHDVAGKQDGFYRIDLESGTSTRLLEMGQCYTCANIEKHFTVTKFGREVAYFAEDAQRDRNIWMSDPSFRAPRQLTKVNLRLASYKMGSARLIDWLSADGDRLKGALLLPSDYEEGKRYPLVVWVYGGSSLSDNFNHFDFGYGGPFDMQLLATRGYAVLFPDAPQHVGTPMFDLTKAVLPGVNRVIEMGIADPEKLGVIGQSYGGYSTLSLIVQTKRFKAAVESDGLGTWRGIMERWTAEVEHLGLQLKNRDKA